MRSFPTCRFGWTITLASAIHAGGCRPASPPSDEPAFPTPAIPPTPETYVAYLPIDPVVIDGQLGERSWERARWTADFVDIRGPGRPAPQLRTRAKMLWDSLFFYVAAELEEPDLWATLTERDAVIYRDNDFEVFIDPDGDTHEYYELEINAFGTVWDLFLVRPYRDGGPAVHSWDIDGLRSAVYRNGTVNQPEDRDSGWSVEVAIPWSALRETAHRRVPPGAGDQWRVNFSRVQWHLDVSAGAYVKRVDAAGDTLAEENWVWSPQGLVNMHYPEMWGIVQFAIDEVGERVRRFEPDSRDRDKWILRQVYYLERTMWERQGRYTTNVRELGLTDARLVGMPWPLRVSVTSTSFEALMIRGADTLTITTDGRVR